MSIHFRGKVVAHNLPRTSYQNIIACIDAICTLSEGRCVKTHTHCFLNYYKGNLMSPTLPTCVNGPDAGVPCFKIQNGEVDCELQSIFTAVGKLSFILFGNDTHSVI